MIKNYVARKALRVSAGNVFISHYMREVAECFVPESAPNNHVVYNGLPSRVVEAARAGGSDWGGEPLLVALQSPSKHKDNLVLPDGRELKRLEWLHDRTYLSIFGPLELSRVVYGSREGQKIEFVPLDHRLQLPESEFSYVLQDWCQVLDVDHAFARAAETLKTILGLILPVDSLERMNRQMSEWVREFRLSRPKPPASEEGELVVVTADGKGVPMRRPRDQKKPAGSHRKKGEKANKKQMATVGAVYTVAPKERTAEEVVAALFGDSRPNRRGDSDEP